MYVCVALFMWICVVVARYGKNRHDQRKHCRKVHRPLDLNRRSELLLSFLYHAVKVTSKNGYLNAMA